MKETLNVLLAYENLPAEARAKELLAQVTDSLTGQAALKLSLWKFSVLETPSLCELAVEEANAADLIVISSTQGAQTPAELESWVKRWRPRPNGDAAALVALSAAGGNDVASLPPLTGFFEETARRNGMEFFCDGPDLEPVRIQEMLVSQLRRCCDPERPSKAADPDRGGKSSTGIPPDGRRLPGGSFGGVVSFA